MATPTVEELKAFAEYRSYMRSAVKPKSIRLAQMAEFVNTHPRLSQKYEARVEGSRTNTDTKVGRLRWPGAGRTGNKLVVYEKADKHPLRKPVIEHDASGTYRQNYEAAEKVLRLLAVA